MQNAIKNELKKSVFDFLKTVVIHLSDDVLDRLNYVSKSESNEKARIMYKSIFENLKLAENEKCSICQDSGVLQFFVEVGTEFPYLNMIKDAIIEATIMATKEIPLRPNVVEPLSEKNTGNNVGFGAPFIEYNLIPNNSDLNLKVYLAGGGCSLAGRSKVLMPLEGVNGIKKFVYETVVDWGVNACPPLCVGIGLGTCATTSSILSKKALLRSFNTDCDNEKGAKLEKEIEKDLNSIGIGPLGFGGNKSVLGVNVECGAHHPATLGVGVTLGCWATRKGEMIIHSDLSCEVLSHKKALKENIL